MSTKKIPSSPAFWLGVALVAAGGWALLNNNNAAAPSSSGSADNSGSAVSEKVVVYKSPSCGCCGNYVSYLKRQGYDVEVVQTQDMESVKNKYEIPEDMRSCHTTVMGDYVIEGHIPIEAMNKLLSERPDIRGIAMPGMPSGSPGMPGGKLSPFTIHSMGRDGAMSVFMEL